MNPFRKNLWAINRQQAIDALLILAIIVMTFVYKMMKATPALVWD